MIAPTDNLEIWQKYIAGAKAWEAAYAAGDRCPMNPEGVRCRCQAPSQKVCQIWRRLEELAKLIGGATEEAFGSIQ